MDSAGAKINVEKVRRYYRLFVMVQALALALVIHGTLRERYPDDDPGHSVFRARADLMGLNTALRMFEMDYNRYPTTEEGLNALMSRPENISAQDWHGPYFDPAVPKDIWRHDYVYRFPGIHNTNSYDLYSCGIDGVSVSGGDDLDDINNWDTDSPRGGLRAESSSEDVWLLRTWRALLMIPVFLIIRIVVAIRSPRFRALVSGN